MNRITLKSSNIQSIGYNASVQTLEVKFTNGTVYQYYEVPPEVHESLMAAASHGKFLNAVLKNESYRYVKL